VETAVICKAAQIGGTTALLNVMGYYIHQEPCPIMLVLADELTAEYMSRKRFQPMFRRSPELSRLIIEDEFNKKEMTFANGAYVVTAWASSVARLASRPCRIVILDEVDKPGYSRTTDEASAISLAMERTETFPNRKHFLLSTPTTENGNIWSWLNSCDVIFDWHVPCPYCGQYQPLRWSAKYGGETYRDNDGRIRPLGQVIWDGGLEAAPEQISNARYQCGECGAKWTTLEKNAAVEKGILVPRQEIKNPPRRVGLHINRLYSLLGRSGDLAALVERWIRVQGDPEELQGFINSVLAEPWKQVVLSASEAEVLKARCDLAPRTIPKEAVALTAGVDVQKYGFWYVVRAWAKDYTSWLIDYGVLGTWEDVEHLLFETTYLVEGEEREMRIWRAAVDIGGGDTDEGLSMTEEVYWWLRENAVGRGCRVWGTKGSSRPLAGVLSFGKPLEKTPSGRPIPGGLQIVSLDTAKLKERFHWRLQQAKEGLPQGAYLHKETGEDYAKQILAEEKQRDRRGMEVWVRIRRDNHLLDAEVMAHACADPEWMGGIRMLSGRPPGSSRLRSSSQPPPFSRQPINPYLGRRGNPFVR